MYLISKDLIKLGKSYNLLYRDIHALKEGIIDVEYVSKSISNAKDTLEWIQSKYKKLLDMVPAWKDEVNRLLKVLSDSPCVSMSHSITKIYLEKYSSILSSFSNFKMGVEEERRNIHCSRLSMVEDALSSVLDELKPVITDKGTMIGQELVGIAHSLVISSEIVKICRYLSDDVEFVYGNFITAASLVESEGSEYNYILAYSTLGLLISKIQGLHEII